VSQLLEPLLLFVFPGGQAVQALALPREYRPTEQDVPDDAPLSEYFPFEVGVGAVDPGEQYQPDLHEKNNVCPVLPW
jgi:hypothetical protein